MAKLAVAGPLEKGDLHDDLGTDPVRAQSRQSHGFGEWRLRDFDGIETLAQLQQQLRVETRSDLAGEDKIFLLEIADEQGAETDASSLGIRETADDQLLRSLALHFEPVGRTAVLVE